MATRNNPSKRGVKPAIPDPVKRKADEVKLREQWDDAYADYLWWKEAVEAGERTAQFSSGKSLSAEYRGWESARKHLLAVSKALADVLGLATEDDERRSKISLLADRRRKTSG